MSSKFKVKFKSTSSAERSKRYRESKQTEEDKENHRLRSKNYRDNMSEEQRKRCNQTAKERMRRYREKKKASANSVNAKVVARETRSAAQIAEDKREYHKIKQREYRAKMNPTKKRWARIKDRDRKRAKKTQCKAGKSNLKPRTAKKEKRQSLDPLEYAAHVDTMIKQATPQERKELEKRNIHPAKVRETVTQIVKSVSAKKNIRKAVIAQIHQSKIKGKKTVARVLGIPYSTLNYKKVMKRKSHITASVKQTVDEFYKDIEVSTLIPRKRRTQQANGYLYVLQKTVIQTYKSFKRKYPAINIGLISFLKLRPKEVKLQKAMKWIQCACDICTNVENLLKAIRSNMMREECSFPEFMESAKALAESTLCNMDMFSQTCIDRRCQGCGLHQVEDVLQKWLANRKCNPLTCRQWESVTEIIKGKEIKRMKPEMKKLTKQEAAKILLKKLKTYGSHCFIARWQQKAFKNALANLKDEEALAVADFAENYTAQRQEEAQSAYYSRNQITIHPVVCWYRNNDVITRDSLIFISNDLKHDASAVSTFMHHTITHLSAKMTSSLTNLSIFSDGAASQYKSKRPMQNIARRFEFPSLNVNWHFFGSHHGKGPSDGESGVVKSKAARLVKSGECVIDNSTDLYEGLRSQLTVPEGVSRRHFFHITSEEIDSVRTDAESRDVTPVVGIRKLHHVQTYGIGGLKVWLLSCQCIDGSCVHGIPSGKQLKIKLGGLFLFITVFFFVNNVD